MEYFAWRRAGLFNLAHDKQIKYGVLYVKDSVLHNCFNHELISVEKSQHVLKDMDVPWIKEPIIKQVNSLIGYLDDLWIKINEKYEKGELKHLRYDEQKKKFIWSKIKAQNSEELENKFQTIISNIQKFGY